MICPICECQNFHFEKDTNFHTKKCTVDSQGLHHSHNDEPAIIYENNTRIWYKHGKWHREDNPAIILSNLEYNFYYYDNKHSYGQFYNKNNDIILLTNGLEHDIFYNKIAIILKKMKEPYNNFYLCLIDNEKRYVKVV